MPELLALGLQIPVMPDGAFYVYADCSALTDDSDQLARDVRQLGIQVPPYRFRILEHLQTALTAHIKVVATVISRNVGRWRTE